MANWYPCNATAATSGHWVQNASRFQRDCCATITWKNWTTSGATTVGDYWPIWNQTAATITTSATNYWPVWNEVYGNRWWRETLRGGTLKPISAEQRAAWREREREIEERAAKERERRKAAEQKAEDLLLANLSPEQVDEYKRMKRFSVHLPDGKVYRIRKGFAGNVELVKPGEGGRIERLENLCIHPAERIPDQDNMLAQKLLLEANEPEFRRIANITRY